MAKATGDKEPATPTVASDPKDPLAALKGGDGKGTTDDGADTGDEGFNTSGKKGKGKKQANKRP